MHQPLFHYSGVEPFADESQHHSVSDPLADQLEQALPTDAVKILPDVHFQHPAHSPVAGLLPKGL